VIRAEPLVEGLAAMQQVEIRVKGRIDERWSEWLDGLTIRHTVEGETALAGSILDQAALYGLMSKLRDLGLSLLSVNCMIQDFPREELVQ
jgi:hypothetical protein